MPDVFHRATAHKVGRLKMLFKGFAALNGHIRPFGIEATGPKPDIGVE